eukprot:NODE_644_length_5619_cov_0.132790.p7 type:complete len:112 gc:universal NODE_644_length_5619_cov_0.132790:2104-1769(-)
MLAQPYSPFKPCTRVVKIRDPLLPMGCPRLTAPPNGLTLFKSSFNSLALASTTQLNASLISQWSICSDFILARFNDNGTATLGAIGKSIGATAPSLNPMISAKGFKECLLT